MWVLLHSFSDLSPLVIPKFASVHRVTRWFERTQKNIQDNVAFSEHHCLSKELSNLSFFLQVVSGISHRKYLRSVVLMKSSTLVFGFCFAGDWRGILEGVFVLQYHFIMLMLMAYWIFGLYISLACCFEPNFSVINENIKHVCISYWFWKQCQHPFTAQYISIWAQSLLGVWKVI